APDGPRLEQQRERPRQPAEVGGGLVAGDLADELADDLGLLPGAIEVGGLPGGDPLVELLEIERRLEVATAEDAIEGLGQRVGDGVGLAVGQAAGQNIEGRGGDAARGLFGGQARAAAHLLEEAAIGHGLEHEERRCNRDAEPSAPSPLRAPFIARRIAPPWRRAATASRRDRPGGHRLTPAETARGPLRRGWSAASDRAP